MRQPPLNRTNIFPLPVAERPGTKPVRLLPEDLVLEKADAGVSSTGIAGIAAPISAMAVEARGLRCSYHDWLYEEFGRCLAQPYEDVAHQDGQLRD